MGGTSVEYLQHRLRQAGRDDLLDGIARGEISTYAAAVEANLVTRKPTLGARDNQSKVRNWALAKITGRSPFRDDPPLHEAKIEARRLAEAYAVERSGRIERHHGDGRRDHGAAHDQHGRAGPEVEHNVRSVDVDQRVDLEPAVARTVSASTSAMTALVPCFGCSEPAAPAAQREVLQAYLAGRRGEAIPTTVSGILPASCCRRQACIPSVAALIG
jgi:hypothetical protein